MQTHPISEKSTLFISHREVIAECHSSEQKCTEIRFSLFFVYAETNFSQLWNCSFDKYSVGHQEQMNKKNPEHTCSDQQKWSPWNPYNSNDILEWICNQTGHTLRHVSFFYFFFFIFFSYYFFVLVLLLYFCLLKYWTEPHMQWLHCICVYLIIMNTFPFFEWAKPERCAGTILQKTVYPFHCVAHSELVMMKINENSAIFCEPLIF